MCLDCLEVVVVSKVSSTMRVYVLLFNARTENEGIHTLKDMNSQRNKVLMFESEEDAARYGGMLEAQDFPNPTVEEIDDEEVKEFCRSSGCDWELVPKGSLALPPEANVDETDWTEEGSQSPASADSDSEESDESEIPEREKTDMSPEELEQARRRLEGLL
jgi:hypothetical protein